MTHKQTQSRAFAQASPLETLGKSTGSHKEYYGASPNPIQSRFWLKVAAPNARGCRLWTGNATGGAGMKHGEFTLPRVQGQQRHVRAHRFAWESVHGSIPAGLCVCHRCDEPLCVNCDHLFLGTQGDNVRDCVRKGRMSVPHCGKLTHADRLVIFHAVFTRGTVSALARVYGVSRSAISLTRRGRFVGAPLQRIHPGAEQAHHDRHFPNQLRDASLIGHVLEHAPASSSTQRNSLATEAS